MTCDEFVGPAVASPLFDIDGRTDADYELVWETDPDDLREVWRSPCGTFSIRDLEWDNPPALLLVAHGSDGAASIGFYILGQSWVDPEWRGRGLAVELVLAAAELVGGSPTANADGMGFSAVGLAVHRKAHLVAVERAIAAGYDVPREVLDEYGLGAPQP
jgi:GNAT superfamily N-acetyltransferase